MGSLKLEHLTPYLPYGLRALFGHDGVRIMTVCTRSHVGRNLECGSGNFIYTYNRVKPILRPLSDLTKEIEHDGEKFVPNVKLKHIRIGIDIYKPLNLDRPLEINIETENYSQQIDLYDGYLVVQKLIEWHFDVFGLIDKDLAVDINTLKGG